MLTRGAAGAVLLPNGTEVPAIAAEAVDTTGAGDAFAGAVCAGIASGVPLEQAVQLALVTAAISVEREGCQPSYRMPRRGRRTRGGGRHRRPASLSS